MRVRFRLRNSPVLLENAAESDGLDRNLLDHRLYTYLPTITHFIIYGEAGLYNGEQIRFQPILFAVYSFTHVERFGRELVRNLLFN